MKTTPLRFSLALLVTATALSGCNWDSSLYETYGRGNVVTQCPPGKLVPATETDKKSYVELKTMRCYAGRVELIGEKGETAALTRNEEDGSWQGLSCVDQNQNCLSSEGGACNRCADYIDDYRICLALQDFTDIFENGNEKMPSISFIGDFGSTNNIVYDYPDAGKYRICPSDYGKCYYHKEDKRSTSPGEFGCVSSCPSTMVECGGQCIDPKTNTAFCGASEDCAGANAGEACADGLSCVNGQCTLVCTKEQVICSEPILNESTGEVLKDETTGEDLLTNRCVDLQKDDEHCGECQHKCDLGLNCIDGKCVLECLEGMIKCPNNANLTPDAFDSLLENEKQCINPLKNSEFCGAAAGCLDYETCNEDQVCQGTCVCLSGRQLCGNHCVDLNTSNDHCGGCNQKCESDEISEKTCIQGKCITTKCKKEGYELCKNNSNISECIDITNDANNCGACGYDCSEHPLSRATSKQCENKRCVYECDSGLENCGETHAPECVNTNTNAENCGGCINAAAEKKGELCANNQYCSNGKCKDSTCINACHLNGECVNTHVTCGTQCKDCTSQPGVDKAECQNGVCNATLCLSNYHLNKTEDQLNGCVENTIYACGKSNSTETLNCEDELHKFDGDHQDHYKVSCSFGECKFDCKDGYYLQNDHCVMNSAENCNGVNCYQQYPGSASVECIEGICKLNACTDDYHLKEDSGTMSCEDNTNKKCGKGNSHITVDCTMISNSNETSCILGECHLDKCDNGYHIKDSDGDTSCEKNSNTSCGATNSTDAYDCTAINHATGKCSSGSCSCKSGYTFKIGSYDNSPHCVTYENCGSTSCHNQEGWDYGWCESNTCYSKTCQVGYHKEKIIIGNDWTANCALNTENACGIKTTTGDQIDEYPISCLEISATCDMNTGLCHCCPTTFQNSAS